MSLSRQQALRIGGISSAGAVEATGLQNRLQAVDEFQNGNIFDKKLF
jgi:hypothetical protein